MNSTPPAVSPPTVSVLMSVYNNDRYLQAAIESILNQTFSDFEFLILDDGSTDRSVEVLRACAARDSRIRLIIRENQGLARSLNQLLAEAQGEFIARMDGDDIAMPTRLEHQIRFLRQHPEILVVGTAYSRIDPKGRVLDYYVPPQTDAELQELLLGGTSLLLHPSTTLRRSAVLQVGGYDETMVGSSDLDLWLRLGEIGALANIPEFLIQYRLHPGSITYRKQTRQTQDAQAACQRAWKRRGIEGKFTREAIDFLKQQEFLRRCGWTGFNRGDRQMAIEYGLRALQQRVTDWESWKLLICALIKPLPSEQAQEEIATPLDSNLQPRSPFESQPSDSQPSEASSVSQTPTVSVLMAVYNTDRYVGEAVASILNQTFTDFELIVIDDGSTDRSLEILQAYAAKDPRIRLVSRPNQGIPKTRNELLSLARGEFLAIMDSDDVALPDRLSRQVAYLRQHPEVLWLGGAFELIDAEGRRINRIEFPQSDREIRALLQQGQTSFLHPTAMLRRSAAIGVGGYDESLPLAEDLDLWFKLAQQGAVANLSQTVVQYRLHPHSICDRHQGLPPKEVQIVLERAWKNGLIAEKPQASVVCGWRPNPNAASRYAFLLKYGWWAFNYRQRGTALFYGTQAIAYKPWSLESWKLLICATLKPLPHA